jgi:hypothetical protein
MEALVNFVINQADDGKIPTQLSLRLSPDGMRGLPAAPLCLSAPAFHTSELWPRMFTEVAAVNGIVWAISIIGLTAFLAVFLFTTSPRVAVCLISTISMALACVLAFFYMVGYKLGIVEAVSISVLLGSSVDYSLHIADAYAECCLEASSNDTVAETGEPSLAAIRDAAWRLRRRQQLAQEALGRIGGSVFHAAVTTFLSVICLVFCQVALFKQFGLVIASSVVSSIIVALFVLPALLVLFGPTVMSTDCDASAVCTGVGAFLSVAAVIGGVWLYDLVCDGCVTGPDGTPLFRSLGTN